MCSCSQLNAALMLGHIKLLTAHNQEYLIILSVFSESLQ